MKTTRDATGGWDRTVFGRHPTMPQTIMSESTDVSLRSDARIKFSEEAATYEDCSLTGSPAYPPPAETWLVRQWLDRQRVLHHRLAEQYWMAYISQLSSLHSHMHHSPCAVSYDLSCFGDGTVGKKRVVNGETVEEHWAVVVKAKL